MRDLMRNPLPRGRGSDALRQSLTMGFRAATARERVPQGLSCRRLLSEEYWV